MQASPNASSEKQAPKRQKLPVNLPRREIRLEPKDTTCGCGTPLQRIGEDRAEKLDYQPGVFTVERHIRGKLVCKCWEKIVQAPLATLAQWVGECGVQLQQLVDALAAEVLRQPVLHADETPVAMLKPGAIFDKFDV